MQVILVVDLEHLGGDDPPHTDRIGLTQAEVDVNLHRSTFTGTWE